MTIKKIANRKGSAKKSRGLNVRGLPPYVLAYLKARAKDATLSVEAYVRSKIVEAVDEKLSGPIVCGSIVVPATIDTKPYVTSTGNDTSIQTS